MVRDTYKKVLRLYIPMAYPWDRVNISQPPKNLDKNIKWTEI